MSGQCVRPGCGAAAVAKLAADFNRRIGWLRDIDAEASNQDYLLCGRHADRMSLPNKWELHDERTRRLRSVGGRPVPEPPAVEAPPAEPPADVSHPAPPAPDPAPDTPAEPAAQADAAAQPPLLSDEPADAAASEPADDADDTDVDPLNRYDPSADVSESTPLLSRAFRAAAPHPDR